MGRRLILSLLCLFAVVVFVQLSTANSRITVNESASRFLVQDQAIVVLEVVNPAKQNLSVRLNLELVDPSDAPRGRAVRDVVLLPGSNTISSPLSLIAETLNKEQDEQLLWYRLRYRIAASPTVASPPDAAAGIISLSGIDSPDLFSLDVSRPSVVYRGTTEYTHVRALHPLTRKPVKDVSVSVELKLDGDPASTLRASAVTDAKGHALLAIKIPAKLTTDEGELKVVARHGGYVRETEDDIDLYGAAQIIITTDKPIYQPGQALHVRALIFNSNKRAAANAEATVKILDPEQTTVFETDVVASRFGVVTSDWTVPDNIRLGQYAINVELDDENYGEALASEFVKISRYDLPYFTVSAKPDRTYYLPQENAEIEVHADYLFGQPVKRGHVRLVREEDRNWNYREQKWDITAAEKYEGETDAAGRFNVHLDLARFHDELASEDYSRFKDITYAAYFTDPTTNRTEQRRFDLRVTKDAIHIYIANGTYRQARGFPMEFYVSTSYADGTPAPADVAISELTDEKQKLNGPIVKSFRTNKYGIAKVTDLLLHTAGDSNPSLKFVARAGAGKSGEHIESFYYDDAPVLRVTTDKIFYRPGDAIKVNIASSVPQLNLFVDVANEANIIESRSISTANGAASFTVKYRPEFRDEITIAAYASSLESSEDYNSSFGSRTVLFPRDRDLKLNFSLNHLDYKPGDEATVDFHVVTPDGRPASSALGVVVFDRAVEERAHTDQDFGGRFGFYSSFSRWRGYDDQVGGITRKDLQKLDLAKPLPEAIESVAELLLAANPMRPSFFNSKMFDTDHADVFGTMTALQLKPVADILEGQYKTNGVYPENGETLRRLLFESGVDIEQLIDPWGTPYRNQFSIEKEELVLETLSAGPDKVFATKDDYSVNRIARSYFRFTGEAINRAVERYHVRTGGFIRDAATLKSELRLDGVDFDSLHDPWGQPYNLNFTVLRERFSVIVNSGGPNKLLEPENPDSDDFVLSTSGIDYLTETRGRVTRALADYFTNTKTLPHDEAELQRALSSVDQNQLRDPWGTRYYSVFETSARFADRVAIQNSAVYGQQQKAHTEITPVTQQFSTITLRSSGADRREGTADDFNLVEFSQLTAEEASNGEKPVERASLIFFYGAKGAIKGTVLDPNGAVIPAAKVTATNKNTLQQFVTETDDSGRFILRNLPVGFYTLRCDASAFRSTSLLEVPVTSSNITSLELTLEVGAVSEVVNVTADGSALNITQQSLSSVRSEGRMQVSIGHAIQVSTPRLREYFPETLVWSPALETDKQGRAQLKFKLADNITTWKMSVIGSTEDGEIGTAETEIKSFQPFFVEHDPPRVLTEGDQISLPVVLRNYLERAQTVDLEFTPEKWFTLQGPARQQANVAAGDAARETFDLTAVASVKDGKQRVTARSVEAGDAIEKPVTVHPDGEEKTETASDVFSEAATLNIDLPETTIAGSSHAEVKIYPNLMAHVVESLDGILERPHGCGEQTISSTYPSLLILRRDGQLGNTSKLHEQAQHYAELGYRRLLNYRSEDGGFTYWGRGEADLALTAYALHFLHDAREFLEVDNVVVESARQWLMKQQQADGSWPSHGYNSDERHTALLTAFIVRVLAMTAPPVALDGTNKTKQASFRIVSPELRRALSYLTIRIETIDEPYLIASYALAAMDAGDETAATRAVAKLRALARTEGDTSYWALESNTPFYGWGRAGRVEATALAVQALARQANEVKNAGAMNAPLVRSGLLFLLRAKDRYGVWYSTQATINVLDTLMTLLRMDDGRGSPTASRVEIIVNGNPSTSLELSSANQRGGIFRADISRFLRTGVNRIELRRPIGSAFASTQVVANYYVPWARSDVNQNVGLSTGDSSSLRLLAKFDRHNSKINEEISCHVKAERVGFSGYGMLLAEIGLPPGADVDRGSLETAMTSSDWTISQYDILPDRVVLYLWPRAGGVEFDFKFRPRFGLTAKAAPSFVYDYYNPDARAVVAPVTFVVK
jgi:hypothetical protein